jgi:proteasome accessory factor B
MRPERGAALRARAGGAPRPVGERDVADVAFEDVETFADEVAGYGDGVVVLGPPALREAVLRRLRAAASLAGA